VSSPADVSGVMPATLASRAEAVRKRYPSSAPGFWGPGGRRFKSCHPDLEKASKAAPYQLGGFARWLERGPNGVQFLGEVVFPDRRAPRVGARARRESPGAESPTRGIMIPLRFGSTAWFDGPRGHEGDTNAHHSAVEWTQPVRVRRHQGTLPSHEWDRLEVRLQAEPSGAICSMAIRVASIASMITSSRSGRARSSGSEQLIASVAGVA
jgi:hypothetical protein